MKKKLKSILVERKMPESGILPDHTEVQAQIAGKNYAVIVMGDLERKYDNLRQVPKKYTINIESDTPLGVMGDDFTLSELPTTCKIKGINYKILSGRYVTDNPDIANFNQIEIETA